VFYVGSAIYPDGMTSEPSRRRVWRPDWPCPVGSILHQHRRGGGDPTFRVDDAGRTWRGIRTPVGPATLVIESRPSDSEVVAEAWGPGADWALTSVPDLLGASDDWAGFEPRHPVLAEARRCHPHARLGRSGLVMEVLVPAIIEQKVTGQEAFAGFRMLVHRYGERAPGPGRERRLWIQPSPDVLRTIPSWEWLRLHIDPARSRALVTAARVAESLERTLAEEPEVADRRLRSLPGIGVWTSAEVRQVAFGDPDAVSFGDYHVAKDVGWALTGSPFDDAELEAFLEPWRPQRGRVPALVAMAGLHRPRRGPRMSARGHLPAKVTRP
jgi:3-methyladenine DNA glycosylase/8-oxoguanine DNA glycosylase